MAFVNSWPLANFSPLNFACVATMCIAFSTDSLQAVLMLELQLCTYFKCSVAGLNDDLHTDLILHHDHVLQTPVLASLSKVKCNV